MLAHQQFLHFGAVQAIGFLAQTQLHAGLHLFVLDHHPQQHIALVEVVLDLVEIGVGLHRIQVSHEADAGAIADGIEQ
ncbi:hypothetical protein D3C81_1712290 [compost metagenome]